MCGICGIIDFNYKLDLNISIQEMAHSIRHRGPDGRGYFIENNLALGHVRLSIIDLSETANQPMISTDNQIIIIFNGEIYNYREIKNSLKTKYIFKTNSDTEVILYAYAEWGENCLSRLNGMFSFVIFDKSKNILFGARDRFGIKPFYYFYNNNFFVFSSEIKGILATKIVIPNLNEQLLYDFIVFNRTDHHAETCFQSIRNIRPGHKFTLEIENNIFRTSQWYFLPAIEERTDDLPSQTEQLTKRLFKSVEMHLVSDVPVGSALSGGLDSSSIVAMMNEYMQLDTINAFSAVYDDRWEKNEKKYVLEMANHYPLKVFFVEPSLKQLTEELDQIIYHQEEPFASASLFASWCIYQKASQEGVKVLLNGQGSDEVFAYDYMAAFYFRELLKQFRFLKLLKEIWLFYKKQASPKFTLQLFSFLIAPDLFKNLLIGMNNAIINKDFFNRYKNTSNFYNTFFNSSTLNENVKNHLLMKLHHLLRIEDRNSMRFSVEARVPFLEHELIEYALTIPAKNKIYNGEVKFILKKAMKSLLPRLIYERNNKIGFATPMDKWFRDKSMASLVNDLLSMRNQPMDNYLNLDYVKNQWGQHKSCNADCSHVIWKYLYLTEWYQIFFKK